MRVKLLAARPPRALTPLDEIAIVYSYASGCSVESIAASLGVSKRRVQRVLRSAGILYASYDHRKLCVLLAAAAGLRLSESCQLLRDAGLGCKSPWTLVGQYSWFKTLIELDDSHDPTLVLKREGVEELKANLRGFATLLVVARYLEKRFPAFARLVCRPARGDKHAAVCSCIRVLAETYARRTL